MKPKTHPFSHRIAFASVILVACVISATSLEVRASEGEDSNFEFYLGLSGSVSPIAPDARDFGSGQGRFYQGLSGGTITNMTEDKSLAAGFKVFAGLRVFKYFGIEVGMADYGTTSYTAEINGGQYLNKGDYSASSSYVAGVLTLPVGDGSQFFVKAGQAEVEVTLSESFQNSEGVLLAGGGPFVTSTRSRHPLIGLGYTMPYGSDKNTALRFEVEHLGEIGAPYEFQASPGRASVLTISTSLIVRF